jgi:hypothetical protein
MQQMTPESTCDQHNWQLNPLHTVYAKPHILVGNQDCKQQATVHHHLLLPIHPCFSKQHLLRFQLNLEENSYYTHQNQKNKTLSHRIALAPTITVRIENSQQIYPSNLTMNIKRYMEAKITKL